MAEKDNSIADLYRCFIEKPQKIEKLQVLKKSNQTVVFCEPQNLASNQYKVGVVSTNLDKIRPSLQSSIFNYQSEKRPQVKDAFYKS